MCSLRSVLTSKRRAIYHRRAPAQLRMLTFGIALLATGIRHTNILSLGHEHDATTPSHTQHPHHVKVRRGMLLPTVRHCRVCGWKTIFHSLPVKTDISGRTQTAEAAFTTPDESNMLLAQLAYFNGTLQPQPLPQQCCKARHMNTKLTAVGCYRACSARRT